MKSALLLLAIFLSSVEAGCLSVGVCANDSPKGVKTCASIASEFETAIECARDEECPSTTGAFAGNCMASLTFEQPKWGCSDTNCFVAAEGTNATADYQIDLTCSETQQLQCRKHLEEPAITECNDETAQRMQKYLDCFRACSGNEYTKNFYAGVCQGRYRLLGCPYEQNSNEWKQCFYPTYKLSTTSPAGTAVSISASISVVLVASLSFFLNQRSI